MVQGEKSVVLKTNCYILSQDEMDKTIRPFTSNFTVHSKALRSGLEIIRNFSKGSYPTTVRYYSTAVDTAVALATAEADNGC